MEELLDMEAFHAALLKGGYIIITDGTRSAPLAHPVGCPSVDATHFTEKVVRNGGRNGRYYWVPDTTTARRELGARSCAC